MRRLILDKGRDWTKLTGSWDSASFGFGGVATPLPLSHGLWSLGGGGWELLLSWHRPKDDRDGLLDHALIVVAVTPHDEPVWLVRAEYVDALRDAIGPILPPPQV